MRLLKDFIKFISDRKTTFQIKRLQNPYINHNTSFLHFQIKMAYSICEQIKLLYFEKIEKAFKNKIFRRIYGPAVDRPVAKEVLQRITRKKLQ